MTKERKKYLLFFCFWTATQSGVILSLSEWLWLDIPISLIMCVCCLFAAEIIMGEK